MRSTLKGIFSLTLLLAAVSGMAQSEDINPKANSPYSRFGLGDLRPQYYAAQAGMGGWSAAYHDPYHLNILNPASLPQLQATAFEVGLDARYTNLQSGDISEDIWNGNLVYLALAFPLINPINEVLDRRNSDWGLGMAFTLQPYTTVGYNITATTELPDVGQVTNLLKGTGGTYRLNWGNGVSYKDFSAGLNLGYQFGKITNSRQVQFDSLAFAYVTEFLDEFSVSGLMWSVGFQYTYEFEQLNRKGELEPSGKRIVAGLYGNSASDFNINTSVYADRFNLAYGNSIDTLVNETDIEQTGTMPSNFTVGLAYENSDKFRIGAEFGTQAWSEYRNEAKPGEDLRDAWRGSVGLEYIPDHLSYNNYFKKVRYRAGFFYAQDPRTFNDEQLTHIAITLGLGFPVVLPRQRTSFVNLAIEGGRFGLQDGLLEEYVQLTLGFTLNDNTWFFKRKFN